MNPSATEATSQVQHVELAMMEAVRFDWQAARLAEDEAKEWKGFRGLGV